MTFLNPRTWVTAELVTATIMNAYLRDPLVALQVGAIAGGFGDASGDIIATGVKTYLRVPYACTIAAWTILSDVAGSIVIDVWKSSYAAAPPTVANTIAGTEKPTLAAQQKNQDLVLTSWTPGLNAGDILAFKVDSCSGLHQATLVLDTLRA
jgi:hypothetical protein